jgi:hypothetical protein
MAYRNAELDFTTAHRRKIKAAPEQAQPLFDKFNL